MKSNLDKLREEYYDRTEKAEEMIDKTFEAIEKDVEKIIKKPKSDHVGNEKYSEEFNKGCYVAYSYVQEKIKQLLKGDK